MLLLFVIASVATCPPKLNERRRKQSTPPQAGGMDCFAALAMTVWNGVSINRRHSGAVRRTEPGISRFRVWSYGPSRNDSLKSRPARIVRAFPRNRHVVNVAFAQARAGDADELRLLVEFGEVACADIAHRGTQTAGELVHDVADRALVRHLALDALGHQLERVLDVLLEVAVGRAARHRADRAHAAIGLVGTALPQKHFARRLVGAGEQRTDHGDVGAGGERLGEIA